MDVLYACLKNRRISFTKMIHIPKKIHSIVYCKRILTDRHIDHRYYTWRYFVVTGQAEHLKVKIDLHLKGCANTTYFVPLSNALFSLPVIKYSSQSFFFGPFNIQSKIFLWRLQNEFKNLFPLIHNILFFMSLINHGKLFKWKNNTAQRCIRT